MPQVGTCKNLAYIKYVMNYECETLQRELSKMTDLLKAGFNYGVPVFHSGDRVWMADS